MITLTALEGAVVEHNPCLSGGALEIFIEPQLPAARLVIVGGSPIAHALARVASSAGYDVSGDSDEAVDGAAAVVVASHGAGRGTGAGRGARGRRAVRRAGREPEARDRGA